MGSRSRITQIAALETLEPRMLLSGSVTACETLLDDEIVAAAIADLTPDGTLAVGGQFDNAEEVRISRSGRGKQRGTLEGGSDVDLFRVVSTYGGPMEIDLSLAGRFAAFDPQLTVFDAAGDIVAQTDGVGGDSRLLVDTEAGQTYYLRATANDADGVSGVEGHSRYNIRLRIPKDDAGDTFDKAADIRVRSNGSGTGRGEINWASDVDMLRFVATRSGAMQIDVAGHWRSNLDPVL